MGFEVLGTARRPDPELANPRSYREEKRGPRRERCRVESPCRQEGLEQTVLHHGRQREDPLRALVGLGDKLLGAVVLPEQVRKLRAAEVVVEPGQCGALTAERGAKLRIGRAFNPEVGAIL